MPSVRVVRNLIPDSDTCDPGGDPWSARSRTMMDLIGYSAGLLLLLLMLFISDALEVAWGRRDNYLWNNRS